MTKAVLQFIFAIKKQIVKKSFQKHRCRSNGLLIVVVIRPNKGIPEIPGVIAEEFVAEKMCIFEF
jgi:hypothetical protein